MGDIVLVRLAGIISRQKTKKIKNFQLFIIIFISICYIDYFAAWDIIGKS